MQRLNEWENAFVELQKMFSLTQRDNAMLNGRVMQWSQQVQHLSERTERLSQLYSCLLYTSGLLDAVQMLLQLLLGGERGGVDAAEHLDHDVIKSA